MKGKAVVPLILGLGIGIATVKLLVDTLRKAEAANAPGELVSVVVANDDIRPFTEITAEMVYVIEAPESPLVPAEERIESIELAAGRVTRKAIPAGSPVLQKMLAAKGARAGMVSRIPSGYRAVSVKIDEWTSVGNQLQPGDFVDVIVVMDVDSTVRGRKETIAEVILQRVQIAAIGGATAQADSAVSGKAKPAKSATLLVKVKNVPKLHLAGTRGKITLAMRGDDNNISDSPARANFNELLNHRKNRTAPDVGLGELLAGMMKTTPSETKPPPRPRAAKQMVMVVRGSSENSSKRAVERITFASSNSSRVLNVQYGPPTRAQSGVEGEER